jgi:hypothetical protein
MSSIETARRLRQSATPIVMPVHTSKDMSPPEEVSGRAHAIAVEDICNDCGNGA